MAVTDLSINRPLYTYSNFVDYDQRVTVKWPKAPPASLPILAYRLRAENSQPQLMSPTAEKVFGHLLRQSATWIQQQTSKAVSS